jgi:hypothetical protein
MNQNDLPVPKVQRAIIRPGHQNVVLIERHGVDDGVVPADVSDERGLWALPNFDVIGCPRGESVLGVVEQERPWAKKNSPT